MDNSRRRDATTTRREQITRAAISLLAARGHQATTFDAICTEAGLSSKRLITYHFTGKDELFAAIADRIAADGEAYVRARLDDTADAHGTLAAAIRANVAFIADHPAEVQALQQILLNGGAGMWERHHDESQRQLGGLFTAGQRAGAFRPFDPHVMAAALRAAIDSVAALLAAGADPGQCADELVELFDRATRAGR